VRRQLVFRVALEEFHHVSRELLRGADLDPEGLESGVVAFLLGLPPPDQRASEPRSSETPSALRALRRRRRSPSPAARACGLRPSSRSPASPVQASPLQGQVAGASGAAGGVGGHWVCAPMREGPKCHAAAGRGTGTTSPFTRGRSVPKGSGAGPSPPSTRTARPLAADCRQRCGAGDPVVSDDPIGGGHLLVDRRECVRRASTGCGRSVSACSRDPRGSAGTASPSDPASPRRRPSARPSVSPGSPRSSPSTCAPSGRAGFCTRSASRITRSHDPPNTRCLRCARFTSAASDERIASADAGFLSSSVPGSAAVDRTARRCGS
jgi:hypothetical protein